MPFATWRVQVGRTLEHLEGLGYPGVGANEVDATAVRARGGGPADPGADPDSDGILMTVVQ